MENTYLPALKNLVPIGEKITFRHKSYTCIKSKDDKFLYCDLIGNCDLVQCDSTEREDKKNVIFKLKTLSLSR